MNGNRAQLHRGLYIVVPHRSHYGRKLGGTTIRSIGHVARLKKLADNEAEYVAPLDMLGELCEDNQALIARMIEVHDLTNCSALASLEMYEETTTSMSINNNVFAESRVWQ